MMVKTLMKNVYPGDIVKVWTDKKEYILYNGECPKEIARYKVKVWGTCKNKGIDLLITAEV